MVARSRLSFQIFVICFAAIVVEISLTRILSFKLVYFFTYAVLGIALLGLGAGGVVVSMAGNARRSDTARLIPKYCLTAAVGVLVGYALLVVLPVNAFRAVTAIPGGRPGELLWEGSKLVLLCLAIFLPFFGAGLAVSTILATNADRVGRLYFYDLVGASLGCALAVPLMAVASPPGAVLLGGALFAVAGLPLLREAPRSRTSLLLGLSIAILLPGAFLAQQLPDPVVDDGKTMGKGKPQKTFFSRWNPVFRVDVTSGFSTGYTINHDGMWAALLPAFDGDLTKLDRFDHDPRRYPFALVERPKVVIIGAAGGHEVLASLYFGASHVTGVELNPVTSALLTEHYVDFTGRLAEDDRVTLVNAEGRSFLMSSSDEYDVVWFVTPDSYSAMNAASSGGHVLSESYLYTVEMVVEALEHLSTDGFVVVQFGGERSPRTQPALSARYLANAREAFLRLGIEDFERHVMVATYPGFPRMGSVIALKRSPITEENIARFTEMTHALPKGGGRVEFTWKKPASTQPYDRVIRAPRHELERWYDDYPFEIHPATDDAPYFWHVVPFRTALATTLTEAGKDHESGAGERLLVTLLAITVVLAAIFLLAPLWLRAGLWSQLPNKARAAAYFAAIGTGFMLFEVSLIQRLTLLLGYPTYSLSVTLFAVLLSAGCGSFLSERITHPGRGPFAALALALGVIGVLYAVVLPGVLLSFVPFSLPARILVALVVLAPAGLCLGMFMPLGLRTIAATTPYREEYVAWAWAINGFFSVGSTLLASILAMILGFTAVMCIALGIYGVGIVALLPVCRATGPSRT